MYLPPAVYVSNKREWAFYERHLAYQDALVIQRMLDRGYVSGQYTCPGRGCQWQNPETYRWCNRDLERQGYPGGGWQTENFGSYT